MGEHRRVGVGGGSCDFSCGFIGSVCDMDDQGG